MHWFLDPITKHYADFSGRASRQQFGMFFLFTFGISLILGVVDEIIGMQILGFIFLLAIFIPNLAMTIRRFHDMGHTGWLVLTAFIPLANLIVFIFLFVSKGEEESNKYGPSPYVGIGSEVPINPTVATAAPTVPTEPVSEVSATETSADRSEPIEENKQIGFGGK